MCDVTVVAIAAAAVAAVGTYAEDRNANIQADRESTLLTKQAIERDKEINQAAGQQEDASTRQAREERAAARAAAAESGVNLGSNSFLAQLQTSQLNEMDNNGIILQNAKNQKQATGIQYQSGLAGLQKKTGLGIAVDMAGSAGAAYTGMGGKYYQGQQPGTG